jgi:hypothetical protein
MATRSRSAALAVLVLGISATLPVAASWLCDFEQGLGQNARPIASTVLGLLFSTTSGSDVYFADITSGWYSVTSDNGLVFEDGEYFVSGNAAAFVLDLQDKARISFQYGVATYFTVGYSSQFPLALEGYDNAGNLLTSTIGPANTKSQQGVGLSFLTVNHPDLAYVQLHDHGGYWMIDNISTDAPVPEPASLLSVVVGAAGLIYLRRRRQPMNNR